MARSLDVLLARCVQQGLQARIIPGEVILGNTYDVLEVPVQRGDTCENLMILDKADTSKLLDSRFEHYQLIDGYEAIWSPSDGVIECALDQGPKVQPVPSLILSVKERLGTPSDISEVSACTIQLPLGSKDDAVTLGPTSPEHRALCGSRVGRWIVPKLNSGQWPSVLTLRFSGLGLGSHDDSKEFLERHGNAVLFEIDSATYVPLCLARQPKPAFGLRWHDKVPATIPRSIRVSSEYDVDALSLYWYARTAEHLPLLRYLAYYQVLEYYGPRSLDQKAQSALREVLHSTHFDPNSDQYLLEILRALDHSGWPTGRGKHEVELRTVLDRYVDPENLRRFICRNSGMSKGLTKGGRGPLAGKNIIRLQSPAVEFMDSVAKRVCYIRCRIVHSRLVPGRPSPILPGQYESGHMEADLDLVEYLARTVIASNARPLVPATTSP